MRTIRRLYADLDPSLRSAIIVVIGVIWAVLAGVVLLLLLAGCSASRVQPDSTPKSDTEQATSNEDYEREWVEARTVAFQKTLPSGRTVECVAFNGAGLWCMEVAK